MEMFGFIDTPNTVSTTVVRPQPAPSQPVVGRHEAIPGRVVPAEESPTAPEEEFDPFADWTPQEVGARLTKGRIRWGLVTSLVVLFAALLAGAYWLYQLPEAEARQARAAVTQSGTDAVSDLTALTTLADGLTGPSLDPANVNRVLLSFDASTRSLFESGGALPASDGLARASALDIAGKMSDAQRLFTEGSTYRNAVIPMLEPPALESDTSLVTLDDASAAFSDWEVRFDTIRASLPNGAFADITAGLDAIAASLPDAQRDYLDAVRIEDSTAAAAVLAGIEEALDEVRASLFAVLGNVQERVQSLIEDALGALQSFPTLLG